MATSFAERFSNKISITNRDGSTTHLQSGETERAQASTTPRSRARMRGARPREKAKAKEERTYAGRQASSRGGGRAQSARASEAAVAAQEELDEEAAMLAELSASVQHPQESPVFEQPHGKGGAAPSPRESDALARARARARPEAATGRLRSSMITPEPEEESEEDSESERSEESEEESEEEHGAPAAAAPVRTGGRPTVGGLHAMAGRSAVSYQPSPSAVAAGRGEVLRRPAPAASAGNLPVPRLLSQASSFAVPPSPPQGGAAVGQQPARRPAQPFSPDALDQFASSDAQEQHSGGQWQSGGFQQPQQQPQQAPQFGGGYGAPPQQQQALPPPEQFGYGAPADGLYNPPPPQQQQPQQMHAYHDEWAGHPAMGGAGVAPGPAAMPQQQMDSGRGGAPVVAVVGPGTGSGRRQGTGSRGRAAGPGSSGGSGPRRRDARRQESQGHTAKLEFAPSQVKKAAAPAAVFGSWNHHGEDPGPVQRAQHEYDGQPPPQPAVSPQVDLYVHQPAPEAYAAPPPMEPDRDSPEPPVDRRNEMLRQSAPLHMSGGPPTAPFSAEAEPKRRSTAGPTAGRRRQAAGGARGQPPGTGGYSAQHAAQTKGGRSYKPGTLKEWKDLDAGYRTRGGLGADLDNPELVAKRERAAKAKAYATAAQDRAKLLARHGGRAAKVGERREGKQEPKRRSRTPGRTAAPASGARQPDLATGQPQWGQPEDEVERRKQARDKAKQYASKVPKPRTRRHKAPSSAGRRPSDLHVDPDASSGGGTGGLPGYIDGLESAHREHQAAVARLRQELLR